MLCLLQCYQSLPREKITDKFLWGRLEPMLGYLSIEQRNKVLEGLYLAFDSHSGQVTHPICGTDFGCRRACTRPTSAHGLSDAAALEHSRALVLHSAPDSLNLTFQCLILSLFISWRDFHAWRHGYGMEHVVCSIVRAGSHSLRIRWR